MRSHLVQLWTSLARFVLPPRSPSTLAKRPALAAGPERLEERVVPSSVPLAGAPTACTCPFCSGAPYSTNASTTPEAYTAVMKWPQPGGPGTALTITYSYSNLLNGALGGGLPANTIRAAIQEALGRWASVSPLRFVEVPDSGPMPSAADYDPTGKPMLRFGHRPIDGAYNVLAYGYYAGSSGLSGDIQFDTTESWAVNPAYGRDLLEVATHEIGHTLGLGHYASPGQGGQNAIMNPVYAGRYHGLGSSFLFADDINGIRSMYGSGAGSVTPLGQQSPSPTPTPVPSGPFTLVGATLVAVGTAGNDTFTFSGGSLPQVAVNGRAFTGDMTQIRNIVFNGQGGTDRAVLIGTIDSEVFDLRPGQGTISGPRWNLTVSSSETIDATGGLGDTITLRDSTGNDTLTAGPVLAQLAGPGYSLIARNFPAVTAVASSGMDRAYLYDSVGNDELWAAPGFSRLSGSGYSNAAQMFDWVNGYAQAGGTDTAKLFDSYANDRLISGYQYTSLAGINGTYTVIATSFESVEATARGGFDVALLYDSPGDDVFVGTSSLSGLYTGSYSRQAATFDQVYTFGSSGSDKAYVYDSTASDTFVVNGVRGTMIYSTGVIQMNGFRSAVLYGVAGGFNKRVLLSMGIGVEWIGSWA